MKTLTLIKDDVIQNENSYIEFDGTLEEAKEYLKDNGFTFIRQSSYSLAVYYK